MSNEYEHKMRVWEKEHDAASAMSLASANAVISFGSLTIKSLLLFNGGAILALLTFYGNILTRSDLVSVSVEALENSITCFVVGAGAGLFCSMSAYVSQVLFTEPNDERIRIIWGNAVRGVAVASGIVSFAAFCLGAFEAVDGLSNFGT